MIEFNGQQYATMTAWARAHPGYSVHYGQYVRDGANTTMKLEQVIRERQDAMRKGGMAGSKASPRRTGKVRG